MRSEWRTVLPFLLCCSVVNIAITLVLLSLGLALSMPLAGITYLALDNLAAFLLTPSTVVVVLVGLLLFAALHVVEAAGIMHAYSMRIVGAKATLTDMVAAGVHAGVRCVRPASWTVVPYMLLLMPLTGFFTLSFSSIQAHVPGFILDFIESNALYHGIYAAAYVALLLVQVLFVFAMNFFLVQKSSFTASCLKSARLVKGRYLFTILCLFVVTALLSAAVISLSAIISAAIVALGKMVAAPAALSDAARVGNWMLSFERLLGAVLAPAVNAASLTVLFTSFAKEAGEKALLSPDGSRTGSWPKSAYAAVALALVGAIAAMAIGAPADMFSTGKLERPEIVAHRGDSANAPENTIPAFELALAEDASWIELDVCQTKDGVVMVSHDDNLKRLSGRSLFMHDLVYEQASQLEVGSRFSEDFTGTCFCTLDEVLKLCKDKTLVQIEIKRTGFDESIEERVLKVVEDTGMQDQVVFISSEVGSLKRLKELDPSATTTYNMFFAFGSIADAEFADYYTVEESNVNPALVQNVHDAGGKIFCWTVNSSNRVQFLVDCGVDGILTDNPLMLRNALDTASYEPGLKRIVRLYLSELASF